MIKRFALERPRRYFWPEAEPGASRSLFFNRVWIYSAIAVTMVGLLLHQQAIALTGFLILVTAGFSALWNRAALGQIRYLSMISADRAFPGDILGLTVIVSNEKPLPVSRLSVDMELSGTLHVMDRESTIGGISGRRILRLETSLRPFERKTWNVSLECQKRGAQSVGPVTLRTGDPFGFFANRRTVTEPLDLLVFPRTCDPDNLEFPHRRLLGEQRSRDKIVTDPLRVSGVRDYRPEDPFRSIHWKASARMGSLQVKVNDPVTSSVVVLFVNLDTFSHYWEGLNVAAAERAIEIAASLCRQLLRGQHQLGLCANGIVIGSDQPLRVSPARGPLQEDRIMTGLARLWPFSTIPVTQVLKTESPRVPPGATVALITPMINATLEEQLSAMALRHKEVLLYPVGEWPIPALERVRVISVAPLEARLDSGRLVA
jgi:uncharacterized protein (DUF58 family)